MLNIIYKRINRIFSKLLLFLPFEEHKAWRIYSKRIVPFPIATFDSLPISSLVCFFVSCDSAYFLKYIESFVLSLDENVNGRIVVNIHLVLDEHKDICWLGQEGKRRLVFILDNLRLRLRHVSLHLSSEIVNFLDKTEGQRRAYFASSRFLRLPEFLLHNSFKKIVVMDIDVVFVNNLGNILKQCKAPWCLRGRVTKKHHTLRFMAGIVVINNGVRSRTIANYVASYLATEFTNNSARWYVDQSAIFYTFQHLGLSFNDVASLPDSLSDWEFSQNSIVWTGKGDRKIVDSRFVEKLYNYKGRVLTLHESASDEYSRFIPDLVVLLPRIDLPFKEPKGFDPFVNFLALNAHSNLRENWVKFANELALMLNQLKIKTQIVNLPNWEITPELIDSIEGKCFLIPHRNDLNFNTSKMHFYYMQMIFPWLFTVDKSGWSAGASVYPCQPIQERTGDEDFFACLSEFQLQSNESKFIQPKKKSRDELISEGFIPDEPYIFFPLQIPHDESIKLFSPISAEIVVEELCLWAEKKSIKIVFKPHPVNLAAMEVYKKIVTKTTHFWSSASVHDLISNARAVYLINSGVGFEALLHKKPVVTFGKVEYDCVTIKGEINNLDSVWSDVQEWNFDKKGQKYKSFVTWYVRDFGFSLKDSDFFRARVKWLASEIRDMGSHLN